jgi:CHAT domain-containing protein/Tfp pilus assembly protein PilF
MKQPKPQDASAWFKRGKEQYWKDKNYEAALASFDRVLDLVPKKYTAWNYRGLALCQLKCYHEALSSFNKSLEIKGDSHRTWNYQGLALNGLESYQEAIISYTKALTIRPTYYQARNNLGNALKNSRYYKEAIASYDRALELTKNQYWRAWRNRGWAIYYSSRYQEALENWDNGLQQIKPRPRDNHQEGCGELYSSKGLAQYLHGQQQEDPFPDWKDAASSYKVALNFLTFEKFPLRHLEVRQALIVVWWGLGQTEDAQELWLEGNALLKRLLQDTPSPGKKLLLARKFAGFTQLGVDWYAQSGNSVAALELAEERKNTCLRWLRYGWGDEPPPSRKFPDLQKLLNSQTAAIYWHVSPAAITTFILRHNQPPQVHSAPATADDVTYPAAARQLRDFENWVKDWKQNYQDYRAGKEKGTEEKLSTVEGKKPALKDHHWRKGMTAKLEVLKNNILDIPGILPHLSDIRHLILIPHRDLHLLPLHDLFPEDFTITYLPSAQIGLDLQQPKANPGQRLLNVENPQNDLRYATVESAAISLLYQDSTIPIKGQKATRIQVMTTMQTDEQLGVFHFTGHGQHDINQPLESSLLLAGEDKLTLRDIFQLDLSRYHLICLSACETALTSKQGLIDEFVGLVSGFLAKGVTYVVSTLWAVDEYSTALLMVRFYQYLQENMTPPSALKEAQKWLRTLTHPQLIEWYQDLADKFEGKNSGIQFYLNTQVKRLKKDLAKIDPDQPLYAHPYYWAGFTVTGKV